MVLPQIRSSEPPNGPGSAPGTSCSLRETRYRARLIQDGGTRGGAGGRGHTASSSRTPSFAGDSHWKKDRLRTARRPAARATRAELALVERVEGGVRRGRFVPRSGEAGTATGRVPPGSGRGGAGP